MSQSADLLALLSDGRPHEMRSIHRAIGFCRLNSRVSELRARGHRIECDKTGGQYVYRLVSRPLEETEVAQGAAVIHSAKGQTAGGERKSAGILGGRVLADTSSVSSSGALTATIPPHRNAPLDSWTEPNGSERSVGATSPELVEASSSPAPVISNHRSAPGGDAASVQPSGQLTLRWATAA